MGDIEMQARGQPPPPSYTPTLTEGLTPQQVEYLRKHFNELDLNGDGYVTSSELMLMFKALKVKVSPETLARLMQEADVNGNGRIEFDEFVALVLSLRTTDQTVWVQLLQRTKPGMLQRAASVSGEFFGVTNQEALRTQQEMRNRSLFERRDVARPAPPPPSAGPMARLQRSSTVQKLRSAVGLKPKDVTEDPNVVRQVNAMKPHKPIVLLLLTLAQIVMMAVEIIVNNGIEPMNINYMAGPSNRVLLSLGAKWAPCMRAEPWKASATPYVPCPTGYEGPRVNDTLCAYYDAIEFQCGMGGFFNSDVPNQYWRFITPMFLHTGIIHLVMNMIFQVWRGFPVERDIGSVRLFCVYFISGIFGVAFGATMSPNQISTGPSGALFSLLAILLIDLILNWKLVVSPVKNLIVLLVIIIVLLGLGLLPFVDNFMHVGGFIAGILSACIFVPHIAFGKWDAVRKKVLVFVALPLLGFIYFMAFYSFYDNVETDYCSWCEVIDCVPPGTAWCSS